MGAEIERRVFVVGAPRSGTTLLQSLLTAHSRVTSFTETHFLSRHFTFPPWGGPPLLVRDPVPRLREFLDENDESATESSSWLERHGRARLGLRLTLPPRTRAVATRLLAVLDEIACRRSIGTWVEKTPRHLRFVPFVEHLYPEPPRPAFVHVFRSGLDVVASLHEASRAWEQPYDLETCVRRWNEDMARSVARLSAGNDHFVAYEALVAEPESVVRGLFTALGLSWEPSVLDGYGRAAGELVTGGETWKRDVGRAIRPSSRAAALSSEDRDRLEPRLRHDLYETLFARAHGAGR